MGKLDLVQTIQEVGLVLLDVFRPPELPSVKILIVCDSGIVAGCKCIEGDTMRSRIVQEAAELYLLVAPDAGVRSTGIHVLAAEVLQHSGFVKVAAVQDMVWNREPSAEVGDLDLVLRPSGRIAAVRADWRRIRGVLLPYEHRDTLDLIAIPLEQICGNR